MFKISQLIIAFAIVGVFSVAHHAQAMNGGEYYGKYYNEPAREGDLDNSYNYIVSYLSYGAPRFIIRNYPITPHNYQPDPNLVLLNSYIQSNNIGKVENLLEDNNINLEDEAAHVRPLEKAMTTGCQEIIALLLQHGAKIDNVRCREHRGLLRHNYGHLIPPRRTDEEKDVSSASLCATQAKSPDCGCCAIQ